MSQSISSNIAKVLPSVALHHSPQWMGAGGRRRVRGGGEFPLQSSSRSDRGFTLIELLVASFVGIMLIGMMLQSVNSLRRVYSRDIISTRVNQDLRGSLDMIGINVRQAGENLTVNFPAIEIIDGASGAPDELFLRRNLLDEVLNVCVDISEGSSTTSIYFATVAADPGCVFSDNQHNYNTWRAERLAAADSTLDAYAFNSATREGEFLLYTGENNDGTELSLTRLNGTWQHEYTIGSSAIYLLEEWHFRLQGDVLQLIVNGDDSNVLNVAFGLTDFQISAMMQDGSTQAALGRDDDWTTLAALSVSLTAEATFAGNTIERSLTSQFFPRNILSN